MPIFLEMGCVLLVHAYERLEDGRPVTAWVQAMASMVWLATWPRFSPVTMALQPPRSAMRSAIRIMKPAHDEGKVLPRAFCADLLLYVREGYDLKAHLPTPGEQPGELHDLSLAASEVGGKEKKWTGMHRTPRRVIIQVETGLSMPLESRVTALPFEPTGSPPAPWGGGRVDVAA